ncbi:MAG: iron-sulfur cluster-binding domain-containing protein, partial [Rhodobacteraceae bacterium]|nr:iron-sulfur cluster-binding domain-containing protein [Paracoccaceae bacterium]
IGVTPILSFATALCARGGAYALHYCTRTAALAGFASQLAAQHGAALSLWADDARPVDLAGLIAAAAADTQIYVCGPRGMIEAVKGLARAAGFAEAQVHYELFSNPAAHSGDQPFQVELHRSGRVFTVLAGQSIIDVLEAAGVDLIHDCRRGDCGICQTAVIAGEPDHRDVVLSPAERASGKVMQICVSRAKSARLVLDL